MIELFDVKFRTVFLDETFGMVDDVSRERVIKILKELTKVFDQIFIISHNDDRDRFDGFIRVLREENGFSEIV